ncbi:centromere protein Q [Ctenodactylus gundi]
MPKVYASKKKSQQLKGNSKRKIDGEEVELSEKESLQSPIAGQTKHVNLKPMKIASNKRKAWQPLSEKTRQHLRTVMDTVVIASLSNSIREKEIIQYHLNHLKNRLLQLCETLKTPRKKLKYLTNVSYLLKMKRTQDCGNEEGLALLQEEIDKIVQSTESVTADIESLKNKIQTIAQEVEEEEEKLKQMFQMDRNSMLSLPELSQSSLKAPILQKEILSLIPNQSSLLKDLDVLCNSSQMQSMSLFIEEAYKKLDA